LLYVYLTLFAAAVAALDQWTKALAAAQLTGRTVVLIPGWLQLHYITNDGMALSLLSGKRWFFVVVAAVYIAFVVWAVAKKYVRKKPELWMLAAITGGAIGNLIDRIATGEVIDMICVPWFSTFNVADIFITVPAVLLVLYILIWDKDFLSEKKPKDAAQDGAEDTNDASDR
jgi:signal peptidase II